MPTPLNLSNHRPPSEKRRFRSEAVEAMLAEVTSHLSDPDLAVLFANCFPNTLDTTVDFTPAEQNNGVPDTYVITGDIDAMWLRDSSAQVNPYLPLCRRHDLPLAALVNGLIRRQTRCLALDPYANAFYKDPAKVGEWKTDLTDMKPGLHERKYELDSLCYPIRLAYQYWKITGDRSPFDAGWRTAMSGVLNTMRDQQRKDGHPGKYHFQRTTAMQSDTVAGAGWGLPIRPTGMICSVFRNSDDAALYLFNIPANLFAVVVLRQLAEIDEAVTGALGAVGGRLLAPEARALAAEVEAAVKKHGIRQHPVHGEIYVYECDGYGNHVFMDDTGLPSLLSLPYLGYCEATDPLYLRTRAFSLSADNPYFYHGTAMDGLGSPHTAPKKLVWPLGISTRGLTATDPAELRRCLEWLKTTTAGLGFMHEGINPDDPADFTRPWFAWSNSLFAEFVLKLYREHPDLLTA